MSRTVLGSILLLAASAATLEGQTVPPRARLQLPTQAPLEAAAARFARVWADGDPAAIARFAASGGVRLYLVDTSHGALSPRQMAAAVASMLEEHRTEEAEVVRVSDAGGSPPRGFAEVGWRAVRAGTVEALSYTVYVGFVLEGQEWRVTELRVMR